ncbi:hypothetical protein LVD15_20640 [Fulvivirga maritima]|uniref:hypothetical protein n=1 Tax=Fulvivirga maritima TaxID=2904247 RepID=UPI001F46D8EF|nr:hypothetical protein [Fulvivirga maritima]UII25690.1 hypothetical protein LVD15_20640 [Fulvivirga maritima]
MEATISPSQQETVDQIYNYAVDLLVNKKLGPYEVKNKLQEQGLSQDNANTVVENLQKQISEAKKSRANKDMLYGALWCVGGIALTVANIGFIFWGAIIFGGVQFIKGAANALSN